MQLTQHYIARTQQLMLWRELWLLQMLRDEVKSVTTCITTGDLGVAAESAFIFLQRQQGGNSQHFTALLPIADTVQQNLVVIRQKADKSLQRTCSRKSSIAEYTNIITAYCMLDHISHVLGYNTHAIAASSSLSSYSCMQSSTGQTWLNDCSCLESLTARVQAFILDGIDECVKNAIIEFLFASQHKKRLAADLLAAEGLSSGSVINAAEMNDWTELDVDELCEYVTPDLVAPCILRSCELLADLICTHNQQLPSGIEPRPTP